MSNALPPVASAKVRRRKRINKNIFRELLAFLNFN